LIVQQIPLAQEAFAGLVISATQIFAAMEAAGIIYATSNVMALGTVMFGPIVRIIVLMEFKIAMKPEWIAEEAVLIFAAHGRMTDAELMDVIQLQKEASLADPLAVPAERAIPRLLLFDA